MSRRCAAMTAALLLLGGVTGAADTGAPGHSAGEARAAEYLAGALRELGALPLPGSDGYRLPFEFEAGIADAGSALTLGTANGPEPTRWSAADVRALSFSDDGSVTAGIVFAGYGLSLPPGGDSYYDSFAGVDLEGKIALVLRGFPADADAEQTAALARRSTLREKAILARDRGAVGLIAVTGPRSPDAGATVPLTEEARVPGVLAVSVSGRVADAIFGHVERRPLAAVQRDLDTGNPHVTGFEIPGLTVTLDAKVGRERRLGHNVVGYLPPEGSEKQSPGRDGHVVLGAPLDDLPHGEDHASDAAAVLEAGTQLARARSRRPVLLAFWSGEGSGMLGARSFLERGPLAADGIDAYLNFDDVGSVRDNRLEVRAVGSSSIWPRLIEQANVVVGFDIRVKPSPFVPTHTAVFYEAGIPAIDLSAGDHGEPRRPDRRAQVNDEELGRVSKFAALLARRLGQLDTPPGYVEVEAEPEPAGSHDAARPFTGTVPDYNAEVEGLRLSGVIDDGPAARAGLAEGDVIVEFDGRAIANAYDYMYALDAVKIGEPVRVVVLRDGERIELTLTPVARN